MQKLEKPTDPIKEVENILKRLAPSALSERATRANDSMIDGLAEVRSDVLKQPARRQHWWQAGIAASLMAGAGLIFLGRPKADSRVGYELPNNANSLELTSDEVQIVQENGESISTVSYREKGSSVIRENGIVMHISWREEGDEQVQTSEF